MKTKILIALALAGLAAFGWVLRGKVLNRLAKLELVSKEAQAKAAAQQIREPPALVLPEPGPTTETLRVTGTLRPEAEVQLGFKVPGRVTDVLVQRGQTVQAGDVVARLDARDLEAQAMQAQAGKKAAEAQRSIAADALKRARQLQEAGAATEQQVVAAAGQTSAISATIEQAQAAQRYVEVIKGETRLITPIDGLVVQAPTAPGFVVQMMSPPVVVVQKLTNVKLTAHLTDRDAARIQAGMAVTVLTAAGHRAQGRLDAVIPSVDPLTRRVPIEGTIANPQGKLFAGAMVEASIEVPSPPTLAVPQTALLTGHEAAVLVAEPDNKLVRRPITVVRSAGDRLLVAKGVRATDRVVANPGVNWREGDVIPAAAVRRNP
ncbi:MAG: efflux RND transporter periplasmic adaptor subunit [Deltaproteobacteria bacterium]|nr:efflux RND transporter periplasmic adaptor subunit [Deltaproteobacteria bacterium]